MRRLAEISLFLPVAAGLHAAAFGLVAGHVGGAGGGAGDGGAALVTLAAAPPSLARLAEEWQDAPAAEAEIPSPLPPDSLSAPAVPLPEVAPQARAVPPVPAPPRADAAPMAPAPVAAPPRPADLVMSLDPPPAEDRVADPAPVSRPSPARAPDGPKAPPPDAALSSVPEPPARGAVSRARSKPSAAPSAAAPARAAQRAAGQGGAGRAGAAGHSAPSLSPAEVGALQAEWGARILARVNRVHRYPRGTRANGRALVELVVARDGRLVSSRLTRSAGDSVLDRAALAAVRRAGRFPPAPAGLRAAQYSFTLPLRFDWRG